MERQLFLIVLAITLSVSAFGQTPTPPPSGCPAMTPANVFLDFTSPTSTCNASQRTCRTGESIVFNALSFGYSFSCDRHEFSWNFGDNTTGSGAGTIHSFANPGAYTIRLTITNSQQVFTRSTTITVNGQPVPPCTGLTVVPTALSGAQVDEPYSAMISAVGGTEPLHVALQSGSLPPGLTLSSTGVISGQPTAVGVFSFVASVTDARSCSGVQSYTIRVRRICTLAVLPRSLPPGRISKSYRQALEVTGGTEPYELRVSSGSLPPGLSLLGTEINGSPTEDGTFVFVVSATDANLCVEAQEYSITISDNPPRRRAVRR